MARLVLDERVKRVLPIGLAVFAGLLAVAVAQRYIRDRVAVERAALEREKQRIMQQYSKPISVVVAGKDIPAGTMLDATHLTTGEVPERFVQPYAAREAGEVVGLITLAPVAAGEQILSNKIRREEDLPIAATLSSVVPKGSRAVTIEVDTLTGVGGFVRPGDVVDVLWTLAVPVPGQDQPEMVTMTLFQDVPVMAVARSLQPPRVSPQEETEEAVIDPLMEGQEVQRYTVTLALPPQEIAFLLFAREQGRVQLSLQSKDDAEPSVVVAPVNMNSMLGTVLGSAAPQGQAPPIRHEIELYKGLERNVVVLSDQPQQGAQARTE